MQGLKHLSLGINNFSGELPVSLWSLSNSKTLDLHANQFVDELSSEILNLTSLKRLLLKNNEFHGLIPDVICDFTTVSRSRQDLAGTCRPITDRIPMKNLHTKHKQKTFIKEYVNTGDAVESARAAGYSDRSLPSRRTEVSWLKRRLSAQKAEELQFSIISLVPRALAILQNLARHG